MESNLIGFLDTFGGIMFYDCTVLGDLPYPCGWVFSKRKHKNKSISE